MASAPVCFPPLANTSVINYPFIISFIELHIHNGERSEQGDERRTRGNQNLVQDENISHSLMNNNKENSDSAKNKLEGVI